LEKLEKLEKRRGNQRRSLTCGLRDVLAYFIYDYFIKEKPAPGSQLPPSSGEEIGFNPMQSPVFDSLRDVITVVYQGDNTQGWL